MLLFILFALPLMIAILLQCSKSRCGDDFTMAIIVWTVILIIASALIFSGPARTRSEIREFEAFRSTLHSQRIDSVSYAERAALTIYIVRENQWLAREQYWCKSIWINWSYDKSILDVKPIE